MWGGRPTEEQVLDREQPREAAQLAAFVVIRAAQWSASGRATSMLRSSSMRVGSREQLAAGRLAVGTRLGKYEILRFIAEGGMGELYVARASGIEGFEKTVALKRILSRFATRDAHVKMFLDEAKLAATLHHPNIVQVFDIGDERGVLFFSMEYVHGTDVRTLLDAARTAGRPMPIEAALEIAQGVAAGLHHAHQAGVIHRDVSPSNVLVAHDGGVKVTDFGVAKMEHTGDTKSGVLKGKVAYMSPEQCRGDVLDRRSDVFAIGILLYELTTLDKPFGGSTEFATMEHIVHRDAEPPSAKHSDYDPELEAITMRALRRDRDERYPTAQDLLRDLRAFARDRKLDVSSLAIEAHLREQFGDRVNAWRDAEVQSSLPLTAVTVREHEETSGTPPVRRVRWPVVAVAGVALAGVGAWVYGSSPPAPTVVDPEPPRAEVRVPAPAAEPPMGDPVPAPTRTEPAPKLPSAPTTEPTPTKIEPAPTKIEPTPTRPRNIVRPPVPKRDPPTVAEPPKVEVAKPPVGSGSSSTPAREVPWDPDSPTFPKRP